ncbi:hypothetical protein H5410_016574 [Solanum commersonii]|uniref:Uncharacterized protein n=1 Tax=Solanum commersonii TaxID=4109 RepID=A0A9J5ZWR2_SOLCO|nr:hypothetical protein H5410_016574 [Solanum commersonii]
MYSPIPAQKSSLPSCTALTVEGNPTIFPCGDVWEKKGSGVPGFSSHSKGTEAMSLTGGVNVEFPEGLFSAIGATYIVIAIRFFLCWLREHHIHIYSRE